MSTYSPSAPASTQLTSSLSMWLCKRQVEPQFCLGARDHIQNFYPLPRELPRQPQHLKKNIKTFWLEKNRWSRRTSLVHWLCSIDHELTFSCTFSISLHQTLSYDQSRKVSKTSVTSVLLDRPLCWPLKPPNLPNHFPLEIFGVCTTSFI